MFVVLFMRWIRSYVTFSARITVGTVERFLNLCAKNGIAVWECHKRGETFTARVSVEGYRRMRPLARQAGVRLQVEGRGGLGFLLYRYRRRLGVITALFLCMAGLGLSQQFIWAVQVEGMAEQTQAMEILRELGVYRGAAKYRINAKEVAQELQLRMEKLAWAGLNIRGTTAILTVRERVEPPEKIDTKVPANVVAGQDGQIKRLYVTDGVPMLRVGDTVRAGEIIVSGVHQDRWGITHMLRANAQVIARIPQTLTVEVPLERQCARLTGKVTKRSYLTVFDIRIPLFIYSEQEGDYRLERQREEASVFGMRLPLGLEKETLLFYEPVTERITSQQALEIAQKQLLRQEKSSWPTGVVTREESAAVKGNLLTLTGEYVVETDIAKQVEIPMFEQEEEGKAKTPRPGGY